MAGGSKAEEVVAEVVEEQEASSLIVTYAPSSIEANFDALEKRVRKTVELYEGATYDLTKADKIKEAKNDRSYLNGLKSEIEERRKAVKREYNKPLAAFEKRCKEITSIIDGASDGIKAQLDEAEERILMLSIRDPRQRLAKYLLARDQRCAGPEIRLKLEDIAASVGLRPETVSRNIARFAREGLIERPGRGRILVVDHEGLRTISRP